MLTVLSAAILIGAEVFGARLRRRLGVRQPLPPRLGGYGVHILQGMFFLLGVVVMVRFVMNARRVEPFTEG